MDEEPDPEPEEESLRVLADRAGIVIGAAVGESLLTDPLAAEAMAREFNALTAENSLKWGPSQPFEGTFDFDVSDALVAFAEEHDQLVRGHTLVWHNQLPSWVSSGRWERQTLLDAVEAHIDGVAGRYSGRIHTWDVVNEAFDEDGTRRESIFQNTIGDDYIELAFRMAHAADPTARLFYNDYATEWMNPKSDAVYEMARDFKTRGVPIHGVGIQMHVTTEWRPSPESVAENMARLADIGIEVHITEMDVRIPTPVTEVKLIQQAEIYAEMLEVCLEAVNCTHFITWGFSDAYSWIPGHFPGWDDALILDRNFEPKPAYLAIRDVLRSAG